METLSCLVSAQTPETPSSSCSLLPLSPLPAASFISTSQKELSQPIKAELITLFKLCLSAQRTRYSSKAPCITLKHFHSSSHFTMKSHDYHSLAIPLSSVFWSSLCLTRQFELARERYSLTSHPGALIQRITTSLPSYMSKERDKSTCNHERREGKC